MKLVIVYIFLILTSVSVGYSVENLELNTDRPDQTESSALVPVGLLQLESGYVFEKTEIKRYIKESFIYNSSLLRYGLTNNLEFRISYDYIKETEEIEGIKLSNKKGISPVIIGIKTKLADETLYTPASSFLFYMSIPKWASPELQTNYSMPGFKLALSKNINENLSFGANLGADWIDTESYGIGFYSLVMGLTFNEYTAAFVEVYGNYSSFDIPENKFDAGITYSIIPNLQIDASFGLGLSKYSPKYMIGSGISLRLPH